MEENVQEVLEESTVVTIDTVQYAEIVANMEQTHVQLETLESRLTGMWLMLVILVVCEIRRVWRSAVEKVRSFSNV